MLNRDVVKRLRERIQVDPGLASFEGYCLGSTPLVPVSSSDFEVLAVEPAWQGQREGPRCIFGKPADASCLKGVGTALCNALEKKLHRIREAQIIGNNAVLTSRGGLCAPRPALTGTDIQQARTVNSRNHQGFVVSERDDVTLAYYVCHRQPRRIGLDALFLHNLEPGNYGSFLFRQLPQMLFARGVALEWDVYVVTDRTPWFYDALRICGFPDKPVLTVREVSGDLFRTVTLCDEFDSEGVLGPDTMAGIRALGNRLSGAPSDDTPRSVFVSRRLTGIARPNYRALTNEEELETLASQAGFVVVQPETLTFSEQVRLFRGARCIAGPSGSGMLNSLFSSASGRVLDIESFHFTVRQHSKIYASAGLEHAFAFGELDPSDSQPLHLRRWSVPLRLATEGFNWVLAGCEGSWI